jgi:DNA polymerase-3 subunit epsilon
VITNTPIKDVLIEIASALKIQRPLTVLDVETTGVWPKSDRIVQIAYATVTPDYHVIEFDQLINPERLIPEESTAIHGITDEDVKDAPTFREVAASLTEALSGHDFIGYNFRFDRQMLQAECDRVDVAFTFEGVALIDPLHVWQRLEPRTLVDASERFVGKRPEEAHQADADIDTTARVLLGQMRSAGASEQLGLSVEGLSSVRNQAGVNRLDVDGKLIWRDGAARLSFGKHQGASLEEVCEKDQGYLEWITKSDFSHDLKTLIKKALGGNFPTDPRSS